MIEEMFEALAKLGTEGKNVAEAEKLAAAGRLREDLLRSVQVDGHTIVSDGQNMIIKAGSQGIQTEGIRLPGQSVIEFGPNQTSIDLPVSTTRAEFPISISERTAPDGSINYWSGRYLDRLGHYPKDIIERDGRTFDYKHIGLDDETKHIGLLGQNRSGKDLGLGDREATLWDYSRTFKPTLRGRSQLPTAQDVVSAIQKQRSIRMAGLDHLDRMGL